MRIIEIIREKLNLPATSPKSDASNFHRGEKAFVFIAAYIIALVMWAMINLDRDFSMDIELPVLYGEFPEDKAPVQRLPEYVRASVSGEGWKLLNLYGSTPRVAIDINEERVDLHNFVQTQMANQSGLTVGQVSPSSIQIRLEDKISKRVPVEPQINIEFRRQFNMVGNPNLTPDSITVTGAISLVEDIDAWPTKSQNYDDLNQPLDIVLELEEPSDLIRISDEQIHYALNVSEFTEGEIRVPLLIRGGEESRNFSLSPSSVLIKYNIPIGQYSEALDKMLFDAFVDFNDISNDASGFVTPNVEPLTDEYEVSIRSIQPQRVSYFQIIQN